MELEAHLSVAPRRHDAIVAGDREPLALSPWAPEDGYEPPTIDQSHDVALVIRLLDRSNNCHGVCNEKILLWGLSGCGKRRIATEAALQFSHRTGCKILWVEGRSFECFIRDYRAAYTIVTGEHLPSGLTLGHTLLKMKATLETRRTEWLMVIFDLQYYLEEDIEVGLNASGLLLPEWCRVLVTSSDVRSKPGGSLDQDEAMVCGLKFAKKATCLHVTTLEEARTKQYIEASGLDSQDLDFPAFRHSATSSIPPLRLALSCAALRLLHVSASRFHALCLQKAKEGSSPMWPGYTPVFADTMAVLWDALNDYNTAAASLLAICSIVDRRDIPLAFVQQFPHFRTNDERFSSVINILRLNGLIEVRLKDGAYTISLHLLQYRWLQYKLCRIQDKDEHKDLVHTWVFVLHKHLRKPDANNPLDEYSYCAEKFWPIFAHVAALCNPKVAQVRQVCNLGYMLFLKHVGILLAEDGLLPSLAGIAVSHALKMCSILRSRGVDHLQLDRHYIHIRQVRATAFLKVSEYRQGETELREAKQVLNTRFANDTDGQSKLRQIQDAETHLCICQGKWQEAIRMLEASLASPEPDADPVKLAQRHYWMSTCKGALDEDLASLEHSHMAMHYWLKLSEEDRWGINDSRRLHWVEKHMLNLMGNRKYKGALLLGRRLLERARDLTPVLGQSISRLTYRVVYCLCVLDKIDEAEATVCEFLEMPRPEREVDDATKAYLLHTLHELAVAMQRNGRTVEAEGLYRLNIRTATAYDVKTLNGTDKYDTWRDWSQLVMCLVEQGKVLEARMSAEEYRSGDVDGELLTSIIQNTLTAYGFLKQLYIGAIEAEKANVSREYRAALDIAGTRLSLKRAVQLFGSVRRRVESGRDFESDIDRHQIARARSSRLLALLGFRLVYLSFVASKDPFDTLGSNEYLWANRRQSVMNQYWILCECRRKRSRARSVDEVYAYAIKPLPTPSSTQPKLKQRLITEWVTRLPVVSSTRPAGCSETCPCIEANKRGPDETAAWESTLLVWKDPVQELPKPKSTARFRKMEPNRAPNPEDELFRLARPNTWWWVHSEFSLREDDNENYILKHATSIPSISITPPDGQVYFLPMAVEPQQKLVQYYQKDYAADFARVLEKEKHKRYRPKPLDNILEDDEDEEEQEKAPNKTSKD